MHKSSLDRPFHDNSGLLHILFLRVELYLLFICFLHPTLHMKRFRFCSNCEYITLYGFISSYINSFHYIFISSISEQIFIQIRSCIDAAIFSSILLFLYKYHNGLHQYYRQMDSTLNPHLTLSFPYYVILLVVLVLLYQESQLSFYCKRCTFCRYIASCVNCFYSIRVFCTWL